MNTKEEIACNDDNENCQETKYTVAGFKSSPKRENSKIEDAED